MTLRKRLLTCSVLAGALLLAGCGGNKENSVNKPDPNAGAGGPGVKPGAPPAPPTIPPPPPR